MTAHPPNVDTAKNVGRLSERRIGDLFEGTTSSRESRFQHQPTKVLAFALNCFELSPVLPPSEKFVPATEWPPQGGSRAGKTWWFPYDIETTFLHHLCRRSF